MQVNANGVISFREPFQSHNPREFPLETMTVLIAPFWDDINIMRAGQIFFRICNNQDLLFQVGLRIADFDNFDPSVLFIATWNEVTEFNGDPSTVIIAPGRDK